MESPFAGPMTRGEIGIISEVVVVDDAIMLLP
jgi:hypothetical protein